MAPRRRRDNWDAAPRVDITEIAANRQDVVALSPVHEVVHVRPDVVRVAVACARVVAAATRRRRRDDDAAATPPRRCRRAAAAAATPQRRRRRRATTPPRRLSDAAVAVPRRRRDASATDFQHRIVAVKVVVGTGSPQGIRDDRVAAAEGVYGIPKSSKAQAIVAGGQIERPGVDVGVHARARVRIGQREGDGSERLARRAWGEFRRRRGAVVVTRPLRGVNATVPRRRRDRPAASRRRRRRCPRYKKRDGEYKKRDVGTRDNWENKKRYKDPASVPCCYFMLDRCNNGAACKFSHDPKFAGRTDVVCSWGSRCRSGHAGGDATFGRDPRLARPCAAPVPAE